MDPDHTDFIRHTITFCVVNEHGRIQADQTCPFVLREILKGDTLTLTFGQALPIPEPPPTPASNPHANAQANAHANARADTHAYT